MNESPKAIKLLRENSERISWEWLSCNPTAINLLRENPEKIIWYNLSQNPNIFVNLDNCARTIQSAYRKSKKYAEWAYHPDRLISQGFFEL